MAKSLWSNISGKIEHLLNYQGCGDIELIFGILYLFASDEALSTSTLAPYFSKKNQGMNNKKQSIDYVFTYK